MVMEEESACASLLALTDSVLQLAQQDSWTPLELQHATGSQPADMWAETQAAMEQVHEMCQRGESQAEARDSPEEAEQWEQIIWPVRPLSCTSPPLSFATVEWDVPVPHVTGCGVANQLDAGGASHVDTTSLSLHHFQDVHDELLAAEGRAEDEDEGEEEEEKIWINSPLLDSVLKETGNDRKPCDAVDEHGPLAQDEEDPTRELLDALTEVPPVADVEPEDERSAASDPAESVGSVDFTDILEDEDEALSFVHLKLEEERETPDVLLTGQEDSEDELLPAPPPPPEVPETEEEDVKENEKHKEEEVEEDTVKEEHEEDEEEEDKVKEEHKEQKEEKKEHEEVEEDKVKEEHTEEQEEHKEEEEEAKVKEEHTEEKEEHKGEEEEDKVKVEHKEQEEEEEVEEEKVKEDHKEGKEEHQEGEQEKVKEEEEVEGIELEEKHEGGDDHSASRHVSVDAVAEAVPTDHTTLTVAQPSEPSEERRRSALDEDAEAPGGLREAPAGRSEESEMSEDAEQGADSAVDNPEVVTQAVDHSAITDGSGLQADGRDQETTCVQQQELLEQLQPSDERQHPAEERHSGEPSGRQQHLELSALTGAAEEEEEGKVEGEEEATRPEGADWPAVERAIVAEAELPAASERREQTEPVERKEQTGLELQPAAPQEVGEFEVMELQQQPPAEATGEHQVTQVEERQEEAEHREEVGAIDSDVCSPQTLVANGTQPRGTETAAPHANGAELDRGRARRLAERLFNLDGFQRVDVVKHVDKDNDFSRAVGEEYLKFFDFTGQTLDHALRSLLNVVVLIGETQERERVLQHFSCRFHQCNPESFPSPGPVLALTCALMLLNTDLHGQNVGKSMSSSKFVSNLDGMNEGENFSKDLLKSLYSSIKSEPLQWAIDEGELMSSMSVDEGSADVVPLRSKTNPFQDVPHDRKAVEVKEGLLQRKIHADVDGKRTPWGKRGWKTFNGVLRGMVLYLQKVDYRSDQQVTEEVVSVHHSLAERAADYTKKPHVFRLQTADWRVFLIQATCKAEMHSWISRINLISALHSSPPFPAAVGSQRRFSRPILPSSQSAYTLERQLQSYSGMLESFRTDLSHLQSNPPEGKKAKAKELEEHRTRAEYLHHEVCRYETYVQVLEAWRSVKKTDSGRLNEVDLGLFDKAACADSTGLDEEEEDCMKRSHSSPAMELEAVPSAVVKVKRNISERRTYRKPVIPRSSKDS